MIVTVVVKEVEVVAQRRMRPDTVKAEDKEETQDVTVTKEDNTGYMIWAKEEEKTRAQVSGCK